MLEIFVNNEKLNLPPDIEVTVTWENPFLLQDRIPLTYAMSFNMPPTKNNLDKFKNPHRQNSKGSWGNFPAYFRFRGISFSQGVMKLDEVQKDLSLSYVGADINDNMKKKLSDLGDIEDFMFYFGEGSRFLADFTSGWALTYKETIFDNLFSKDKFTACPIRVKDEEWRYAQDAYGNYNADRLYLNMWNVNAGNYLFTDGAAPKHGVIFPQPYVHYILAQVFGSSLKENFFASDPELMSLVMITSYHQNYSYNLMATFDGILVDNDTLSHNNHFVLSSFMNAVSFNNFLKNLLNIFCCSLIPGTNGKIDILHNKDILESQDVIDWTEKLVGVPQLSMEKAKSYEYGYASESLGDTLEHYNLIDSIDDLLLASNGEGTYQIANTGEVYEKKLKEKQDPADPDEYSYELVNRNVGGNITSTDEDAESYNINSAIRPIPMRLDEYWWLNTNVVRYPWYVPEFPGDRFKKNSDQFIGFMRGFYDLNNKITESSPRIVDTPGKYPFLSPYNQDMAGNRIGNYSLAWEGPDGLIAKFHSEFKDYIESDKLVLKGTFRLSELDLKNLSYKMKILVRGKLFYIKRIEATFRKNSISLCQVELKEA